MEKSKNEIKTTAKGVKPQIISIKNICIAVLIAIVFWLISLVGRALGDSCYTFDWVLNRNLYLCSAIVTTCPSLFGKWRFSCSAFIGSLLGIACGELFGKNPSGAELGFGHYGWLYWSIFFVVSILIGIFIEVFYCKKIKKTTEMQNQ